MRNRWYRMVTAVVLASSLFIATHPLNADSREAVAQGVAYPLTETIAAEVKRVVNGPTPEGTRLGAVVKLTNHGKRLIRVPDYEVRMRSKDGIEYILQPSAANPTAIQPLESVELQYMMIVETALPISLSYLVWVEADWEVYPKAETEKLTIPIDAKMWLGLTSDGGNVQPWGKPFSVPELAEGLLFTPVSSYRQMSAQGPVTLISILVENTTTREMELPDFYLDGRSGSKVYNGSRAGKPSARLASLGKQYLHFAIPTGNGEELERVTLLTENTFLSSNQKAIKYSMGWTELGLLKGISQAAWFGQAPSYSLHKPIALESFHSLIHPNVELSLVEMHLLEGRSKGYKTISAKFKLTNKADVPQPLPAFRAELVSKNGLSYTGNRTGTDSDTLLPEFGYLMTYTFVVPMEETGEQLALRILDAKSAEPYSLPIGGFRTQVQQSGTNEEIDMYPFRIRIKDYTLQSSFNPGVFTYSYKARLNLELDQEEKVLADQGLSKLKLELADATGNPIGTQSLSLTGDNRITTGETIVKLGDTNQMNNGGIVLNVYEAVETPYGEAVRLLRVLK